MSPTIHRYRTQQKSHCKKRYYRCQIPKFLQNLSLLLSRSFCPLDTIAITSSARPIFASSLRDVFSFVLRCFRFLELVHGGFPWSMFTYNLIELYLIRTMLGLTMLINWVEVSSQSIRGIYIPAEVVSVKCIRVIGLSMKRELLLPAITQNLHFSANIFFFDFFFLKLEITLWPKNQNLKKIADLKVYGNLKTNQI